MTAATWPPHTDAPEWKRNTWPSSRALARMSGYSASHMAKLARGSAHFPHRRGLDGKTYPGHRLTSDELETVVLLVHGLRHDGMSVRQIKSHLHELGIWRSTGSISGYLTAWPCRCNVRTCTPEHESDR